MRFGHATTGGREVYRLADRAAPAMALPLGDPTPVVIAFEVPGEPQPQGSSKAFKHRHTGRVMVTSDNARLRPWRDAVCWHARQALLGGPLAGPVQVELEFRFARPAGHFGKRGLRPAAPREHMVRPDLDKLVRAVQRRAERGRRVARRRPGGRDDGPEAVARAAGRANRDRGRRQREPAPCLSSGTSL